MKNACIFHGTSGSPDHFWHPYVKRELEEIGYGVWVPQLPDTDNPNLEKQLPFVLENHNYNECTVLIGHSAGCPLILSLLQNINTEIKLAILVAGFCEQLSDDPDYILQKEYDWNRISSNCKNFVFINSVNDPWGCNDKQGRKMFDQLGGELIIRNEGHMGSESFNQPYKEFPLLVNLVKSFE